MKNSHLLILKQNATMSNCGSGASVHQICGKIQKCHRCTDGGARNGDTRVDDYAWYAMEAAGLIKPSGRPVGIRAQSKYSWETWTVEYKSDGKGGIMFRFGEKAGEPVAGDKFREAMAGK